MTQFLRPKFSVAVGGQAYSDGWDRIFGISREATPAKSGDEPEFGNLASVEIAGNRSSTAPGAHGNGAELFGSPGSVGTGQDEGHLVESGSSPQAAPFDLPPDDAPEERGMTTEDLRRMYAQETMGTLNQYGEDRQALRERVKRGDFSVVDMLAALDEIDKLETELEGANAIAASYKWNADSYVKQFSQAEALLKRCVKYLGSFDRTPRDIYLDIHTFLFQLSEKP